MNGIKVIMIKSNNTPKAIAILTQTFQKSEENVKLLVP